MAVGRPLPSRMSRPALRQQAVARHSVQRREVAATPVVQALAEVHGGIGNDVLASPFTAGAELGALPAHALGGLALGMAGVETASLSPGQAPLSVMRAALRHAEAGTQAEAEGLDTATAMGRIGKRGGQPLPEPVRERMERAFGHDFRHVRIHTDGGAAAAADALHAVAFAVGHDLYFGPGAFRPGTPAGDALLAHELTHVVQADEGRLPRSSSGGLDVSRPTDPHEREAEAWSRLVTQALSANGPVEVSTDASAWTEAGAALGPGADLGLSGVDGGAPAAAAPESGMGGPGAEVPASAPSANSVDGAASVASRQARAESESSTPVNAMGRNRTERRELELSLAGELVSGFASFTEGEVEEVEVELDQAIEQGEAAGMHLLRARLRLDRDGSIIDGEVEAERDVGEAVTLEVHIGGEVQMDGHPGQSSGMATAPQSSM